MKLVSHTHINGNGDKFRDEYARILAKAAKKRGFSHCVIGCHGTYIASKDTMNKVREIGIIPVRFAELNLTVDGNPHKKSHVALLNIPEAKIEGYNHSDKTYANINDILPYIKKTKCKVVLCHPESIEEIKIWSRFIDGYEIKNGKDRYDRIGFDVYKNRDASKELPNLIQFYGADYHVWYGTGDMDYYTELPDNWFGKIYE